MNLIILLRPTLVRKVFSKNSLISWAFVLIILISPTSIRAQSLSASMPFPAFNSSYLSGSTINIQVTATTSTSTTITDVEFFVQDNFSGNYISIGHDNTAPYSYTWTAPSVVNSRSYQLRAIVTNSVSATAISNPPTNYNSITVYSPTYTASRNWYVNAAAATNTAGTESQPLNTIQKAADRVAPGDTVFIMAGTYTATSLNVVTIQRTGTPTKWIVFRPYKTDKPLISMGDNNFRGIDVIQAAAYIKIQGIEVKGNNGNVTLDQAKQQPGACEGPNPSGVQLAKFNGSGIRVSGSGGGNLRPHHINLMSNIVHECGAAGIGVNQSDYLTLEENIVYNNSWYTVSGSSGITILGAWNYDNNTDAPKIIIRKNRCFGNILKIAWNVDGKGTTCRFYDGNGIILDSNNGSQSPIGAYNGKFLVENNLCYLNGGRGINLTSTDNVLVVNNTTYQNGQSDGPLYFGIENEFYATNSININVYNNIFYGKPGETPTSTANGSTLTYNNNLTFGGATNGIFIGNQNIIGKDPLFVNATGGDFRLSNFSPAINAGSNVEGQYATTDYVGVNRPKGTRPDIGAYEFEGTPVAITQQPASTSTVCAGTSVSVSVGASGEIQSYQWYKNGNAITGVASATTATLLLPNVTKADTGKYSVLISGFTNLTSSDFNLTVRSSPVAVLTPASATLTCDRPSITLTASADSIGGPFSFRFSTGEISSSIVVDTAGPYSMTVTDPNGCTTSSTTIVESVVNRPQAVELSVDSELNCLNPTAIITGGSSTPNVSYSFVGTGVITQNNNRATVNQAGTYMVIASSPEGCTASASVEVKEGQLPIEAPGINSVSAVQGGSSVTLTVANCSGIVNWNGIDGSNSLVVSTSAVGDFSYMVTCKLGVCTSPVTSLTVSVKPPPVGLSVWYKDGDTNQPTNNIIRPYFSLYNTGNTNLAYSDITFRYWLTVEDFAPMTNLAIYWAQIGTSKVRITYVPLTQPRQGALGYIEYSFDASTGNLVSGSNSGEIQTAVAKQNWTNLNETDDYSFTSGNTTYVVNNRITVYYKGTLVGGVEPPPVAPLTALKIYHENKNSSTSTNQIRPHLQVVNIGNVPINYEKLTIRYWFSSEGNSPLAYYVDYTGLGNSNVLGRFIKENRGATDTYLELSFSPTLGQLQGLSSTGIIQHRFNKSDWSTFNEANDYSFQPAGSQGENTKITAYLNGSLVYGQEPASASPRLGIVDSKSSFQVSILNNPIQNQTVECTINANVGQSLQLRISDRQGRIITEYYVKQTVEDQLYKLNLGQCPAGIFFLQVNTQEELQTLRILKN